MFTRLLAGPNPSVGIYHARDFGIPKPCAIRRLPETANRRGSWSQDAPDLRLLCAFLAQEFDACLVHGIPTFPGSEPCDTEQSFLLATLDRVNLLDVRGDLPDGLPQNGELEGDLLYHLPRVYMQHAVSRSFAGPLYAAARASLPMISGSVFHPVFGEPEGKWLTGDVPKAGDPNAAVAWVNRWELDPASRVALGVYLCGCFHACSLTEPRPVLLADSWVRGMGKSTLCSSLAYLIDGRSTSMALSGGARQRQDAITAHLSGGYRCLVGGNIEQEKGEWNEVSLVSLATDPGFSDRAKYAARTTAFEGTLVMLNAVYGAVVFAADVIDRAWRVETQGRRRPELDENSLAWTKRNRDAIVCSVLRGHKNAQATRRSSSRFASFESAGIGAWAALTGISQDVIEERLNECRRSSLAYSAKGLEELRSLSGGAFDGNVASVPSGRAEINLRGARALGYLHDGESWKELK